MWIKICGMTTPEAVATAVETRVDAIGFVFAPSVRRVSPIKAAQLAAAARGRVRCIAVMRHPRQSEVDAVLADFVPDVLQTDLEDLAVLRLPRQLELLPVLRSGQSPANPLPRRVLFEGEVSGSGTACDWSQAHLLAQKHQLVLAGGLDSDTLAPAIEAVRPFGVDVSTGVEARPGIKSPEKIRAFVEAARYAEEMSS